MNARTNLSQDADFGGRQVTQLFNTLVRISGEVETNVVSVERILEYSQLPSEAPAIIPSRRPAIGWPAQGGVKFVDYSTRYRPGLDLVLRNINLDINPRERIGVVGRTGAGKSSLAMSLLRIIEPASGSIQIDGLDTSTIGLLDLRDRLNIVPQDAALFEGTIRENLDPRQGHDDTELWTALGMLWPFPYGDDARYRGLTAICRACAVERACG